MEIQVYLADGDVHKWTPEQYTSYTVQGGVFIVMRDDAWVGIYPLGQLRAVMVR